VNCRLNEEKVFPSKRVSRVLEDHYIEARLHTDGEKNIDRTLELQKELAQSVATPFYLVIEPRSGLRVGGTTAVCDSENRALYFSKEVVPYTSAMKRLKASNWQASNSRMGDAFSLAMALTKSFAKILS